MTAQVHVEDVGTELIDTLKDEDRTVINISTATAKKIQIKRPDGTVIGPFDAAFDSSGTDGKIKYVSLITTFTIPGVYEYQFWVTIASKPFYGNTQQLTVYPNISNISS